MWLLAALLGMGLLHWLLPGAVLLQAPWRWIGLGPVLGGLFLVLATVAQLHRAHTGIRPFSEATTLVRLGGFHWSRNPIYLGMVAVVSGTAIALGSLTPLVVPPLFWLVLDRRFVRNEERFLQDRFGAAYDDYCQRVRRWL